MKTICSMDLILQWKKGSKTSLAALFSAYYQRLKAQARYHMSRERVEHSMSPSDLLHNLYPRLCSIAKPSLFDGRGFFFLCKTLFRRILVDHSRKRKMVVVPMNEAIHEQQCASNDEEEILLLRRQAYFAIVLQRLREECQQKAQIIDLVLAGKKGKELYEALGKEREFVERHRASAIQWLRKEMSAQTKRSK